MGCLDLDFYIPPIAGQEKPGERLLSQEENPEEDPPMFLKMEVESAKDEPNNNNIFDTWSLTENDEDTVLNRRFEEDEDGEEVGEEKVTSDVFLEEAQIKVECLDWDENIDSHGKGKECFSNETHRVFYFKAKIFQILRVFQVLPLFCLVGARFLHFRLFFTFFINSDSLLSTVRVAQVQSLLNILNNELVLEQFSKFRRISEC